MEVRGQQPSGPQSPRQRFEEVQAELARANRERVRRAREALYSMTERRLEEAREARRESHRLDSIDLSAAARVVLESVRGDHDERVTELKRLHDAGQLNTPDRVQGAAVRILGG
jgi:hypothetical protein